MISYWMWWCAPPPGTPGQHASLGVLHELAADLEFRGRAGMSAETGTGMVRLWRGTTRTYRTGSVCGRTARACRQRPTRSVWPMASAWSDWPSMQPCLLYLHVISLVWPMASAWRDQLCTLRPPLCQQPFRPLLCRILPPACPGTLDQHASLGVLHELQVSVIFVSCCTHGTLTSIARSFPAARACVC